MSSSLVTVRVLRICTNPFQISLSRIEFDEYSRPCSIRHIKLSLFYVYHAHFDLYLIKGNSSIRIQQVHFLCIEFDYYDGDDSISITASHAFFLQSINHSQYWGVWCLAPDIVCGQLIARWNGHIAPRCEGLSDHVVLIEDQSRVFWWPIRVSIKIIIPLTSHKTTNNNIHIHKVSPH